MVSPKKSGLRGGGAGDAIDVVVLSSSGKRLRCRRLDGGEIFVQTDARWGVPGLVVTLHVHERGTTAAGAPLVVADVVSSRVDVPALRLERIPLERCGPVDPAMELGLDDGEPVPDWARPIVARGPRDAFELEDLVPMPKWGDDDVLRAMDQLARGETSTARKTLFGVLAHDLRALAAHAALGAIAFDRDLPRARLHYTVGAAIGDVSLGAGFDGVLPWGLVDNRPFLRCLHGLGLTLWRLDLQSEAGAIFRRMLWLNPRDNQGVRMAVDALERGLTWQELVAEDAQRSTR